MNENELRDWFNTEPETPVSDPVAAFLAAGGKITKGETKTAKGATSATTVKAGGYVPNYAGAHFGK